MKLKYYFIIAIAIMFILWLLIPYVIVYHFFPTSEHAWSIRGQFGDIYGVVNSLFSGLVLTAIAFTVYLQYLDLREQSKILSKQNELMKIQLQRESWLQTPLIYSEPGDYSGFSKNMRVWNYGERMLNISIKTNNLTSFLVLRPLKIPILKKDAYFVLAIDTTVAYDFPPIDLEFHYTNSLGERNILKFYIKGGTGKELVPVYGTKVNT